VLTGVVVAELRGAGEPLDDLDLRGLELAGPLPDLGFQDLVLALDLEIEEPRFEQRADAEQHFIGVVRLADEVLGAAGQRLLARLRRHVAGHHQDREIARFGDLIELVHHLEAAHLGHVQVEQDQVRTALHVEIHRQRRIGRGLDPPETGPLEEPAKQFDVRPLVVDDEDSRVLEHPVLHACGCGHRRESVGSTFVTVSTAGESGHTGVGAAVYAACASIPWNSDVSDEYTSNFR
jgi:hypothetical protein